MYALFQSLKLRRNEHHIKGKLDHPVLAYHIIWFHIPGSLVLRIECRVVDLFWVNLYHILDTRLDNRHAHHINIEGLVEAYGDKSNQTKPLNFLLPFSSVFPNLSSNPMLLFISNPTTRCGI